MDQYLNFLKVLYIVEEVMLDDIVMVVDGGDFVVIVVYIFRLVYFVYL